MKITIELDGILGLRADAALSTPSVPIPPPQLLKRAKALGAVSAGPSTIGAGAAMRVEATPAAATASTPAKRTATKKKRR